jgi:hypothetical protein
MNKNRLRNVTPPNHRLLFMTPLLRPSGRSLFLALVLALPAWWSAVAQEGRALRTDRGRAPKPLTQRALARRTAALTLPFFDDFANDAFGARPDPMLWDTAGGAYRNDRFARRPPSRGAVSFDGLNAYGEAYGGSSRGDSDTLTSAPIDISGQTGVVLSFWWQAGGKTGNRVDQLAPGSNSHLYLDVDDGTGFWTTIWDKRGTSRDTKFQQVFLAIDPQYISANFRFRFRRTGIRLSAEELWNIDYVELDANRQTQPTPIRDAAFSQPLKSSLVPYSAMPVWQFNATTPQSQLLAEEVVTSINNLNPDAGGIPTPLGIEGNLAVVADASGSSLASNNFLTTSQVLPAATVQRPFSAPLRSALPSAAIPVGPDYKTLKTTLTLVSGELTPATQYNDTIRQTAALRDYYAYDDGTAEFSFYLNNLTDPGAAAIAFNTAEPDQVAAVEIYLAGDLPTGLPLSVNVWGDDPAQPGTPASTSSAQISFRVPQDSVLRSLGGRWWPVWLPAPVPVNGRFYVGYTQPANSGILTIGWDLNDSLSGGQLFYRARTDPWSTVTRNGVMIRPHMNHNGILAAPKAVATASVDVFPNPVSATEGAGAVRLQGEFRSVLLLDAVGRTLRSAAAGTAELSVRDLLPGLYFLQFQTSDGARITRRLVVSR